MTNTYLVLKRKHQEEVNNFPMVFAFNDKQFEEAMEKLGFSVTTRDYVGNVVSVGGGGYIRKADSEALHEILDRHENEMVTAIDSDTTGYGFIFDMFVYELANHEYGYTGEIEPTLDALGFTFDEVKANDKLLHGLEKACKEQS